AAAQVARQLEAAHPRRAAWHSLGYSPALASIIGLALSSRPAALLAALPVLVLWCAAPELALWTGRSRPERTEQLTDHDRDFLRRVARRSWVFFEAYVRPEDNWLPPDNHQEAPIEATAHRTSPTNVGLMALSSLAAWRFGHIGVNELAVRMHRMLDGLERLERWRGHMLNWYDTRTLAPLEPRYVSTVDSGNLAVSLITLQQGCLRIAEQSPIGASGWHGLDECIALLGEALEGACGDAAAELAAELGRLRAQLRAAATSPAGWPELIASTLQRQKDIKHRTAVLIASRRSIQPGKLRDLRLWLDRTEHHLAALRRDVQTCLPWLEVLASAPPSCTELAQSLAAALDPAQPLSSHKDILDHYNSRRSSQPGPTATDAQKWLEELDDAVPRGLAAWSRLAAQIAKIGARAGDYANAMEFAPLYNPTNRLFHIGYSLSAERLDQHHYDLLASEARLASYFAIAKRDVPVEHWVQLGRPIVKFDSGLALASWNGSMFEYLMPTLFLRSEPGTLLGQSDRTSVDLQKRHGDRLGIPWGISESGFASVGQDGSWRYRAFGLTDLGLRRGLSQDTVIAPYASALALAVRPHAAVANLRRLAANGMIGRCGFLEAADYTGERQAGDDAAGANFVAVASYMAHHQGMSLGAYANALFDNLFVNWFHSDPRIATVDLLLNERVPWELPTELRHIEPAATAAAQFTPVARPEPWIPLRFAGQPGRHIIGNGRLAATICEDGQGELSWQGKAMTRPGEVHGGNGHFIYLRDSTLGADWTITRLPLGETADRTVQFHAHKAEFHARAHGISANLEVVVAGFADLEIRRLHIVNETAEARRIEVASSFEVALARRDDWLRHPAFSRLFVASEFVRSVGGLLHTRRLRSPGDEHAALLHYLVADPSVRLRGWECDRARLRPRLDLTQGFPQVRRSGQASRMHTLDPVSALCGEIELAPFGHAELAFVTIAATSGEEAIELAARHSALADLDWIEQETRNRAAHNLSALALRPGELPLAQQLFTALFGPGGPRHLAAGQGRQSSRDDLWTLGISGDLPILLHELAETSDGSNLRTLAAAHRAWRRCGANADIVLTYPGMPGYVDPIRDRLMDLLRAEGCEDLIGQRGGFHLIGSEQADPVLLEAVRRAARIATSDKAG
ncbi:MAG: hypothetical protein RL339_2421, partial [Pseudomonadota bacterium]